MDSTNYIKVLTNTPIWLENYYVIILFGDFSLSSPNAIFKEDDMELNYLNCTLSGHKPTFDFYRRTPSPRYGIRIQYPSILVAKVNLVNSEAAKIWFSLKPFFKSAIINVYDIVSNNVQEVFSHIEKELGEFA